MIEVLTLLAIACAPVPPKGEHVEIAEEEALIIWNEEHKTETFIRRAVFETTSPTFGFLVPTPEKPMLDEVPNTVFDQLELAIAPAVKTESSGVRFEPFSLLLAPFTYTLSRSAGDRSVRVLEMKRVGGYNAVVLEADDAQALAEWLHEFGFEARPELTAWLAPYVEAKWKLTAFKISRDENALDPRFGVGAVMLRFSTPRPFFPYREPEDQRTKDTIARKLRVYLISGSKMSGALEHAPDAAPLWPGKLEWAGPLPAQLVPMLQDGEGRSLKDAWLTAYLDASSPRPGTTELVFDAAQDHAPYAPPPIVRASPTIIPLPLELPIFALLLAWYVRGRRRRKKVGNV